MGSSTATSSRVVLEVANTATQTSIAKCVIVCDQVLSNNTVIISPGAVTGDITFENICVIKDASCMINQNIQTNIVNILRATVDQTALSTQPLFSLVFNSTKATSSLDEVISNQIQQMVSSSCTIATNQELNNNYIYVGEGATVGDISFVQHSTLSNVECVMDIASKADSYNEETGDIRQRAVTVDVTSLFIIAIVVVVIMVVVFMVIFFLVKGSSAAKKKPPPGSTPETAIPVATSGTSPAGVSPEVALLASSNPETALLLTALNAS